MSLIDSAVSILRRGGLVGLPTETVYGLAADAENEVAVRRIFAAKGRPADHPLIVHLATAEQIFDWTIEVPDEAWRLAERFWPGPLTIVLKKNAKATEAVTGGLETIALRVPAHPIAQQLLKAFAGGLAAPSANRFGRVSPTAAEHVAEELGDQVELILDGGPCQVGLESTIVDLSGDEPALLRPGAVTPEQVESVLGRPLGDPARNTTRVSGRLESHYAPRAAVELVTQQKLHSRVAELAAEGKRVALLGDGSCEQANMFSIELSNQPVEFARNLYAALRSADAAGAEIALIVPPPESGLGMAIADRLRKASAPRGK